MIAVQHFFLISLESSSFIYRLIKSVLLSFQVFDVGIYCLCFTQFEIFLVLDIMSDLLTPGHFKHCYETLDLI